MVLAFSVNLGDALKTGDIPKEVRDNRAVDLTEGEEDSLLDLPAIEERFTLEGFLQATLRKSLEELNVLFIQTEAPQTTGETVSVRYAFWLLDLNSLPKNFPHAWELLEIAPFNEIYPESNPDDLIKQAVILKRNEVLIDRDSDEPLAYNFCPMCASAQLHRSSQAYKDETLS